MKFNYCFLMLVFILSQVYAQNKIIPASPEVAQLTHYNQLNISPYSGLPKINIDLYEVRQNEFSLPITLNYSSGGIKVEEISTWVGLGWSLNAGGSITREIRGLEDRATNNLNQSLDYLFKDFTNAQKMIGINYVDQSPQNSRTASNFHYIYTSLGDTEPDIYYYNFGSFSGRFVRFSDGSYQTIPKSNIKVESIGNQWVLTNDDGTKYVFGGTLEYTDTYPIQFQTGDNISNWCLVEIVPLNSGPIKFEYTQEKYSYRLAPTHTAVYTKSGTNTTLTHNYYYTLAQKLKKIEGDNFYINFESVPDRKDLDNSRSLKEILIYSKKEDKLIKKYLFSQSYFVSPTNNPSPDSYEKQEAQRLRLDSINTEDSENGKRLNLYKFEYNNQALPHRLSSSVDYWGFYNGAANGNDYLPQGFYVDINGTYTYRTNLANRRVNETYSRAGTLTKITNATKGYELFEYESNRINRRIQTPLYLGNLTTNTSEVIVDHYATASINGYGDISNEMEFTYAPATNEPTQLSFSDANSVYDKNLVSCICECFNAKITGVDNPARLEFTLPSSGFMPITTLEYGKKYKLSFYKKEGYCQGALARIVVTLKWKAKDIINIDNPLNNSPLAGGLRIKRYNSYDNNGKKLIEKRYSYLDFLDPSQSSGILVTPVIFSPRVYNDVFSNTISYTYTSNSFYPLSVTDGNYVGYDNVEVRTYDVNDSLNFQVDKFEYTSYLGYPDIYFDRASSNTNMRGALYSPKPPIFSNEHMRGKLLKHSSMLKNKQGEFIQIATKKYDYKKVIDSLKIVRGISYYQYGLDRLTPDAGEMYNYVYNIYEYFNNNFVVEKEVNTTYNEQSSNPIVIEKNFFYHKNNPNYLTKVVSVNSDGLNLSENFSYVYDFANANTTISPYVNMYSNNFVSQILKTENFVNNVVKTSKETTYSVFNNKFLKPNKIIEKSGSAISNTVNLINYDSYGNIRETKVNMEPTTTYLWGYNGQYPIAEIKNATYADVVAVLTQPVIDNLNLPTHTEATMETLVNNVAEKLRTDSRLAKAMVTSYTYKPLVGMTSQTDSRGVSEYFKYDGMQRLRAILDHMNYVTKVIDYHYRSN